jgi:hypothetical protein
MGSNQGSRNPWRWLCEFYTPILMICLTLRLGVEYAESEGNFIWGELPAGPQSSSAYFRVASSTSSYSSGSR